MQNAPESEGRKDAIKTLAWGAAWLVGACWFVFYDAGNPITDFREWRTASQLPSVP